MEEAKKQIIMCFPDIQKQPITPEADFIFIACDGIWDVFTDEVVT